MWLINIKKYMERWIIYAIISMLFVRLNSVIAKFGMKNLSSDTPLTIRTSIVFTIVIANAFILRNAYSELQNAPAKNLIFLAISGTTTSLS